MSILRRMKIMGTGKETAQILGDSIRLTSRLKNLEKTGPKTSRNRQLTATCMTLARMQEEYIFSHGWIWQSMETAIFDGNDIRAITSRKMAVLVEKWLFNTWS